MDFWNTIRNIFRRQEEKTLEENLESDILDYTGYEPDCWACQMPIHKTQRHRKLQGKKMHSFCFKKIKRIAMRGGTENDFY